MEQPIDIFLSHDWPRGVYNHGNRDALLRRKPFFAHEVKDNILGSEPLAHLMAALKPRYWFAGHMHVRFEASISWSGSLTTEFLALDKCVKRRSYMEVRRFSFVQVVNVSPRAQPNILDCRLLFDCEWLSILGATEPYLSGPQRDRYPALPEMSLLIEAKRRFLKTRGDTSRAIEIVFSPQKTTFEQTNEIRGRLIDAALNPEEMRIDL